MLTYSYRVMCSNTTFILFFVFLLYFACLVCMHVTCFSLLAYATHTSLLVRLALCVFYFFRLRSILIYFNCRLMLVRVVNF
jgi:hypothetical protein